VAHRLVYSPEAQADLIGLYQYIAERSSPSRALSYVERIEAACRTLAVFPRRGIRRDDLYPGLRMTSVARRVAVTMLVDGDEVRIIRVLYGGRDLAAAFPD